MKHCAIKIINIGVIRSVLVISDNHFASSQLSVGDDIIRLRDKHIPVLNAGFCKVINTYVTDFSLRGIVISKDVHDIVYHINWRISVVHIFSERNKLPIRVKHIADKESMTRGLTALCQEHKSLIVSEEHAMEITRLCGILIKQLVIFLAVTKLMIIDFMVFINI